MKSSPPLLVMDRLSFFVLICTYYGLPLHIMRDLYLTCRSFRSRVADFIRYRRITHNMQERFPDATEEDLERTDRICIICREKPLRSFSVVQPPWWDAMDPCQGR